MKKIILTILIIAVLGGIIFAFVKFSKNGNIDSVTQLQDIDSVTHDTVEPQEEVVAPEIKKVDSTTNTYVHKKYNFTFNYPSEFKTSNFNEGGGEQILFNSLDGDWFQIYITPWDEEGDITVDRIKQDLPDLVIKDPQNVILGPQQKSGVGPRALIFFSKDSTLGETREAWFVMGSNLYQVTTYKKLDTMIGKVLSTLVFK